MNGEIWWLHDHIVPLHTSNVYTQRHSATKSVSCGLGEERKGTLVSLDATSNRQIWPREAEQSKDRSSRTKSRFQGSGPEFT